MDIKKKKVVSFRLLVFGRALPLGVIRKFGTELRNAYGDNWDSRPTRYRKIIHVPVGNVQNMLHADWNIMFWTLPTGTWIKID